VKHIRNCLGQRLRLVMEHISSAHSTHVTGTIVGLGVAQELGFISSESKTYFGIVMLRK
jgi:hypothetical protein